MIMKKLFDEFPQLESDRLTLREWAAADAPAIEAIIHDPDVYRFLPTFLYEQSYEDVGEMVARSRKERFDTHDSILLGIFFKNDPERLVGIAEVYNYEPEKEKASIGYRLNKIYWGNGIASETTALLVKYLIGQTDVRKITAHVMAENAASARVLEKNGFVLRWTGLREDWGRGAPVLVNKYMYKLSPEQKQSIIHLQNTL